MLKLLTIATILLFSTSNNHASTIDIARDFGTSGWEYLQSNAASGGTEKPLISKIIGNNVGHTGLGGNGMFNTPSILAKKNGGKKFEIFADGQDYHDAIEGQDLLLHPSDQPDGKFVLARYTVQQKDLSNGNTLSINGNFYRGHPKGDSVSVFVFVNETRVFSKTGHHGTLEKTEGSFDQIYNQAVTVGDSISFVVGRNEQFAGDETTLRATLHFGSSSQQKISKSQHQPQSSTLISMGGLSLSLQTAEN